MSRLARVIFGLLVAATVAAFFVSQHLKSTTPVLTGNPHPSPAAISPGQTDCGRRFARTALSFYLLHRADDVSVYVVDAGGTIVRTIASARHMRRGVRHPDGDFTWNGRGDDGHVVPDGDYRFRVALIHQNRTITIASPVTVETVAPHPAVVRVSAGGAAPALLPAAGGARIEYRGNRGHVAVVLVYRTDLPGPPRLVASFPSAASPATWDGRIHGRLAPAGTYLIGLAVTDRACNTGRFPAQIPPTPGSTAGAGVTVRYLAALPQLDPAPGGGTARVLVDARRQPYTWALRRLGARRTVAAGHGSGPSLTLRLPRGAGLYELAIAGNGGRIEVPVVAHAARRGARILVVLPALTWQGLNAADVRGDGIPVTLDRGGPAALSRPFAAGLPAGFGDEAQLLAYLDRAHLPYDLTTDLGLIDGIGPGLYGHSGVVLDGSVRWAPTSLTTPLRAYVRSGGRVASIGPDSLRRTVMIAAGTGGVEARDPSPPQVADALGATTGPFVTASPGVVLKLSDALGLFTGTSGAFPAFSAYQPITGTVPPAGQVLSAAGPSSGSAAVAGWSLANGVAVEIGVSGFGSALAGNVDAQELTRRLWTILSR